MATLKYNVEPNDRPQITLVQLEALTHYVVVHPDGQPETAAKKIHLIDIVRAVVQAEVGAADTIAPFVQSSVLQPNFLSVHFVFSEAMDGTSVPPTSAFTLGGSSAGAMAVSSTAFVASDTLAVTFAAALPEGGAIDITYSGTSLRDTSSNAAAGFTRSFSRAAAPPPPATPPALQTAALDSGDPTKVRLTYDRPLASATPPVSAFTLPGSTVSAIAIASPVATLTLAAAFPAGTSNPLSYAAPASGGIQGTDGAIAASFSGQTISRAAAGGAPLDVDFTTLSALPSGFTVQGASTAFSSQGLKLVNTSGTQWANSGMTGPLPDWSRPVIFYYQSPTTFSNNYAFGFSQNIIGWLNRTSPVETLFCLAARIYLQNQLVQSFTQVSASSSMRAVYTKVGADIALKLERFENGSWVLRPGSGYTMINGVSLLANSPIAVDPSDATSLFITRIVN